LAPNWGDAAAREAAASEEAAMAYFIVVVLWGGMRVEVLGDVLIELIAKTIEMQMQDNKRKPSSKTRGLAGLIYYYLTYCCSKESKRLRIIRCQPCRRIRAAGNASPP
jgi:hypothetical protein